MIEELQRTVSIIDTVIITITDQKCNAIYATLNCFFFWCIKTPNVPRPVATMVARWQRRISWKCGYATEYWSCHNRRSLVGIKSDVDRVCKYSLNQPEHHRKNLLSHSEEYTELIRSYQRNSIAEESAYIDTARIHKGIRGVIRKKKKQETKRTPPFATRDKGGIRARPPFCY